MNVIEIDINDDKNHITYPDKISRSILSEDERNLIKKSSEKANYDNKNIGYGSHHSTIEKGWSYNPRPKPINPFLQSEEINTFQLQKPIYAPSQYKSIEERYYDKVNMPSTSSPGSVATNEATYWSAENLKQGNIVNDLQMLPPGNLSTRNITNGSLIEANSPEPSIFPTYQKTIDDKLKSRIDALERSLEMQQSEYMNLLDSKLQKSRDIYEQNQSIQQNLDGKLDIQWKNQQQNIKNHANEMTKIRNDMKVEFDTIEKSVLEYTVL